MKRMKFEGFVGIVLSGMMILSLIGCGESTASNNDVSEEQESTSAVAESESTESNSEVSEEPESTVAVEETESTESNNEASEEKGSMSNPYVEGDTITIPELEQDNIQYSFTFTIDKIYSRGDWGAGATYPLMHAKFQIDGENDDAITYMQSPVIFAEITDEMEYSNSVPFNLDTNEQLNEFYTGVEYNVYITGDYVMEYKYCALIYTENNEEQTIYIALD